MHEFLERSLNASEAKLRGGTDAKKAAAALDTIKQIRSGPRIKAEATTNGFDVEGRIQIPATVLPAASLLLKSKGNTEAPSLPIVPVQLLKKFDPKIDKPFQTELGDRFVTVEDNAWRLEAKKATPAPRPGEAVRVPVIQLFELPRQQVQNSTIVLRFSMKTEKVTNNVSVRLSAGDGGTFLENAYGPISGTTNWNNYEIRYTYKGTSPASVFIMVDITGTGTIWLKDIELVKIPAKP